MKHTIKHSLDQEMARKVARKAFESYAERFSQYNPTSTWTSDDHADIGFKVKGLGLDGSVDLRPGAIDLDLDVPFIFRVFRKKAMSIIEEEIRTWIAKAESGEFV